MSSGRPLPQPRLPDPGRAEDVGHSLGYFLAMGGMILALICFGLLVLGLLILAVINVWGAIL